MRKGRKEKRQKGKKEGRKESKMEQACRNSGTI